MFVLLCNAPRNGPKLCCAHSKLKNGNYSLPLQLVGTARVYTLPSIVRTHLMRYFAAKMDTDQTDGHTQAGSVQANCFVCSCASGMQLFLGCTLCKQTFNPHTNALHSLCSLSLHLFLFRTQIESLPVNWRGNDIITYISLNWLSKDSHQLSKYWYILFNVGVANCWTAPNGNNYCHLNVFIISVLIPSI